MFKEIFVLSEAQFKRVTQSGSRNLRATLELQQEDFTQKIADTLFALKESGASVRLVGFIEVEEDFLPENASDEQAALQEIEHLHN